MQFGLFRSTVYSVGKRLGPRGAFITYGLVAITIASLTAIATAPDRVVPVKMSAADFSQISSASAVFTPTFDDAFWNGGDMSSDRHWRSTRRSRRRVRAIPRPAAPIRINISIPKFNQPVKKKTTKRSRSQSSEDYTGYGEGTYRTVCVRMCDGFYWPISFNGENGNSVAKDAEICRNSCAAPTKLFIDNDPGTDIEQMVDRSGRPYSKLKNAYRYRNEYVSDCKCRANPWEVAAVNRHKYYALLKTARKNRAVAKLVRKQRKQIAKVKRQKRKERRKEWRRIAKVDGFWAKSGDTRYSLGAKEVPYTDDEGYPIEILASRPSKKKKPTKYVRRAASANRSKYIRMGNPFNSDGANFADPSVLIKKSAPPARKRTKPRTKRRTTRIDTRTRMRLTPAKQSRPARRSYSRQRSRPSWASEVFNGN